MKFINLCQTFEAISLAKDKRTRLEHLRTFIAKNDRSKFYNALRLFLPQWERERGAYRLGETTFTRVLAAVLRLTPHDVATLKNFSAAKAKDYAEAAFAVVRKRVHIDVASDMTVDEVNVQLDALAAGDVRAQEKILAILFKTCSRLEVKWLLRVILKDMKIGLGKADLLNAYHPDGNKYFIGNNSLQQLCADLIDLQKSVADVEVSLLNAFRPMLSVRCTAKEFAKLDQSIEYVVEEKFDGERFQLHLSNGAFRYYSRNGYDYTENFRKHAAEMRPAINADNCILDGEMMLYLKSSKSFGCKAMNADVKNIKDDSANVQQCFCVFDVVHLNGVNTCSQPLSERKRLLQDIVKPITGRIQLSVCTVARNKKEIVDALNQSMDMKKEGVVFKHPNSKYAPNERSGWWKLKHEYFEGVMSDLDVLIIGGYYGGTKGNITAYLVAAKDERGRYLSFAKLSTGLNRVEWLSLNAALSPNWRDVDGSGSHEKLQVFWGKERPHKWIAPEDSRCLLVRGSELIRVHGDYRTEYTLRFPRIVALRLDKPFDTCLTTGELASLTTSSCSVEKLTKRHLELSDLEVNAPVKKSRTRKTGDEDFIRENTRELEQLSNVLAGRAFVVISGVREWSKLQIQTAIREHGGRVQLAGGCDTHCLLVGAQHSNTRHYNGDCDIVHVEWLRRTLNAGEFLDYEPADIYFMCEKSRPKFMREYDRFGDAYAKKTDRKTLRRIIAQMTTDCEPIYLTVEEITELNTEMGMVDVRRPLRGYVAYVDPLSVELRNGSFLQLIEWKSAGGKISLTLNEDCDCVIAAGERCDEVRTDLIEQGLKIPVYSIPCQFIEKLESIT